MMNASSSECFSIYVCIRLCELFECVYAPVRYVCNLVTHAHDHPHSIMHKI